MYHISIDKDNHLLVGDIAVDPLCPVYILRNRPCKGKVPFEMNKNILLQRCKGLWGKADAWPRKSRQSEFALDILGNAAEQFENFDDALIAMHHLYAIAPARIE